MKKFLLILFVIASAAKQSHTQTNVYHPFPDSAFWRIDVVINAVQNGGCQAHYNFHYYTSGDTLINSSVHRKVYKSFVYLTSSGPASPCDPAPPIGYSGYVGALRDDSVANKTFFVPQNKSIDTLLYNYNLKVGDTLQGLICDAYNCCIVVLNVDSVLISGLYRKRWMFNACGNNNQYIIEGIGTSAGLIEGITGGNYLVCVKESANALFVSGHSSAIGCNLIYAGINEIKIVNDFTIFPNPTTGIFTLSSSEKISSIEITDILGNVIKKFHASTLPSTPLGMTIDLSSHQKGIYFLKAEDEKGNFGVRKIVLQ